MNLFSNECPENLLPNDGTAMYFGKIIDKTKADEYFEVLINTIPWQQDEVIIYGKRHVTKRKTAWFGDNSLAYKYSGTTRTALPWTTELKSLKLLVEKITGETFNSCLLNLYH